MTSDRVHLIWEHRPRCNTELICVEG